MLGVLNLFGIGELFIGSVPLLRADGNCLPFGFQAKRVVLNTLIVLLDTAFARFEGRFVDFIFVVGRLKVFQRTVSAVFWLILVVSLLTVACCSATFFIES